MQDIVSYIGYKQKMGSIWKCIGFVVYRLSFEIPGQVIKTTCELWKLLLFPRNET